MKAKRLLASALALSMAFGAMSALAVTANAAGTTATITAIKADGTKVEASYTNDGILDAINAAGNGGTVEIGEGVVAISPNADYSTSASVTIKGQGIGKTTIKPADPEAYDAKKYEARHMLEILASDFKLENLTLDSSEVPGAKFLFNYPISTINFVPLRLSGSTDSNNPSNIVLNNIEILRDTGEKCKGCIQIGTNSNPYRYANVTATDLYVDSNAGESSYADIDICDGSSLTLNGGGFSGIVLGTFSVSKQLKGYYSKAATIDGEQASAYISIPYLLHCYDVAIENNDANSLKEI